MSEKEKVTPGAPVTPATPATPGGKGSPAAPATPASPARAPEKRSEAPERQTEAEARREAKEATRETVDRGPERPRATRRQEDPDQDNLDRQIRTLTAQAEAYKAEAKRIETETPFGKTEEHDQALREAAKCELKAQELARGMRGAPAAPAEVAPQAQMEREVRSLMAQAEAHKVQAKQIENAEGLGAGSPEHREQLQLAARCELKAQRLAEDLQGLPSTPREAERVLKARAKAREEKEGPRGRREDQAEADREAAEDYVVKLYRKDNRGPGRRHADIVFELNQMHVEPRDRRVGTPGSGTEPDWNQGAVLQDLSGQPAMVFEGAPPLQFKQAWRDGREIYGVIVFRDNADHN